MAAPGADRSAKGQGGSDQTSAEALKSIEWPRRLTLIGLWAERLARAFWPLWSILLLAFSAVAFGLHDFGSLLQLQIGLGLVALAALIALVWGWRKFRRPTSDEALIRLDASLPGRPIATLRDAQAIGADDAQSVAVWRVHLARMAEKARAARAVPPDLQLASRDRLSLRYVALTAAVMAALFGSFWRAAEVVAIGPGPAQAIPSGPTWEGWARPPAYTGKPVLYLNDITAPEFEVPVGSRIQIRVYGDQDGPAIEQTIAQVAPPAPAGEVTAAVPEGLRGLTELVVSQSGRLSIGGTGGTGREWQVIATPDNAPSVELTGEMGREADGRFRQKFKASDDYGVTAGRVTISLDADKVIRRYGLEIAPETSDPVTLDLPMPVKGDRREVTQTLVDDLSEHLFSNMPVSMVFSVSDAAGNEGQAQPLQVTLPGKRFFDPMANAVVEMRRDILWNRENLPRVLQLLKAIGNRPEELARSQNAAKRLRVLVRGADAMAQPLTDTQRDEVAKELWEIAFMFEEGDLNNAFERLQRAQDRLEEAMRNGASPEEINDLMKEMQQAMREYLKELRAQDQANGNQDGKDGQDGQGGQGGGRTITDDQLQKLLDEIERLMKEGKTAEAMQLMEELRQLMENLEVQNGPGGQGEGQGQGQGTMRDLGETLKDQQGLSDDAYRDMQRGRNGQGGGTDPGELADRQRELRDRLNEMQNGKMPGDGSEKGEEGRERLGEAEQAMREAEEALRQGDLAGALDKQAEAMERMRQGMRDLGEALADIEREPGAEGGNQDPREARRVDPNAVDPLGREPGSSARIGSDRNMVQNTPDQRAQELLDEIRRRSGEAARPDAELDYLRRLLELF
ncbi:DUF4175 domain-containing protein [Xinfangfangia sp. D13-10-4-6]|uniref:DUF4175 domain-containing protein n=1 Tax=Pseudogemmobacter hezensis TaxID=2737662 RepID=UPI0015525BD8|nr:DUF4175 domain-containing protein [Pseudogemmobacter hezensis]NPD14248.1 DUF4175 domain-containing protein [Pseudogemmobacter hezensis]